MFEFDDTSFIAGVLIGAATVLLYVLIIAA